MKVAVFGGNGKVGKLILQKLKNTDGFEPLSIIRSEAQVPLFEEKGINTKVITLTDTVENLSKALKGQDAIIYSAGSGGSSLEDTFAIDLDGAVKAMEVAEAQGIKRFVLVSALEAENRDYWYDSPLRSYYIAKKYADRELERTNLEWTILRPGFYTGEALGEGTGKLTQKLSQPLKISTDDQIIRDDVADVAVEVLKRDNTIHKIITLISGDTPTAEFLSAI